MCVDKFKVKILLARKLKMTENLRKLCSGLKIQVQKENLSTEIEKSLGKTKKNNKKRKKEEKRGGEKGLHTLPPSQGSAGRQMGLFSVRVPEWLG